MTRSIVIVAESNTSIVYSLQVYEFDVLTRNLILPTFHNHVGGCENTFVPRAVK